MKWCEGCGPCQMLWCGVRVACVWRACGVRVAWPCTHQHVEIHVLEQSLGEHEASGFAVDGDKHENQAGEAQVELSVARDRRAERDHQHGRGNAAARQRLAEERLHHHRHYRRESL